MMSFTHRSRRFVIGEAIKHNTPIANRREHRGKRLEKGERSKSI